MRRDVVAVNDDSIAHKAMSLLGGEQVNALPEFVKRGERFGGIRARENQCGFVVERAQTSVEVIAIWIDQLQGHDWNPHFEHRRGKFLDAAASAAKAISAINAGTIRMPEQITVAFKVVVAVVEIDDAIVARAKPVGVMRYFALPRGILHATGHYKFSVADFLPGENLIGREDHIFEAFNRMNSFNFAAALLQNATEIFPLAACFRAIHWELSRHVGIFLIDDIEIIRRTEQNFEHTINGSRSNEAPTRNRRRSIGLDAE